MKKVIEASDFGIVPGEDVAEKLSRLLRDLAGEEGEKQLNFREGVYFVDAEKLPQKRMYITNTVGDREWKRGEEPHLNRAAIFIEGVSDLTIEGGGARFVLRGTATNAVIRGCRNVMLKDIFFDSENPDMHELTVVRRGAFCIDYAVDGHSDVRKVDGKWCFAGRDYVVPVTHGRPAGWWIGKVTEDDENSIVRVSHPLTGAFGIDMPDKGLLRAHYVVPPRYKTGDVFCLFDVRRKYNGIVVDKSENIRLCGVEQNFNYGLAVVCQCSKDVSITGCRFVPVDRYMASVADFVHVCMCRGKVEICGNTFKGSGDDCLNVHGVHFKAVSAEGKRLKAAFCHSQTHGFDPFLKGDVLRVIGKNTLREEGRLTVESSRMCDEYTIEITVKENADGVAGKVIENASACPDVDFCDNVLDRVITRGVLVTTAGKVRIAGNRFLHTSMHAVLISDDARSWYESGMVRDVEISGNYFGACRGYTLMIKPENTVPGTVHENVRFTGNTIESGGQGGFYLKDCAGVVIRGNSIAGKTKKNRFIRAQYNIGN